MRWIRGGQFDAMMQGEESGSQFTLPGFDVHYAPDLGLEPSLLDLHLAVDLPTRSAVGMCTWHIVARRDGESTIRFDAVEFEIETVVDVDGHELSWRHDGTNLLVHWADAPAKGSQRKLRIEWHVETPRSGMFFGGPADGSSDDTTWMATDHETERARYWLPCIDQPNVRTTIDVHLRAQSHLTRVTAGSLVDETLHDDGTTTSHWCLEQRCPSYLLCVLVGEGEGQGVVFQPFAP